MHLWGKEKLEGRCGGRREGGGESEVVFWKKWKIGFIWILAAFYGFFNLNRYLRDMKLM